eukprot:TRINITY_DN24573_c0_g1_i4.p3 TRINITY_DN24573_c0_g1~~TRINITY_DN24573_c0_g1_i4.p3  ORF type:complete len:145 (+),score=14.11 TRINITY_DN24573_c0_g1_i4:104-538(+)
MAQLNAQAPAPAPGPDEDTPSTLQCRECGRKEHRGIEEPDVRVVTSRQNLVSRTVVTGHCAAPEPGTAPLASASRPGERHSEPTALPQRGGCPLPPMLPAGGAQIGGSARRASPAPGQLRLRAVTMAGPLQAGLFPALAIVSHL